MRRITRYKVGYKRRIPYNRKSKIRRKSGSKYKKPISSLFILFTIALNKKCKLGYWEWRQLMYRCKMVGQEEQYTAIFGRMLTRIWKLDIKQWEQWLGADSEE